MILASTRKYNEEISGIILKVGIFRGSHSQLFLKVGSLKSFSKFTGKHLWQKLFLTKVFSYFFVRNF